MLIYMIPFILLLGIAIVLKKREANKQAEQTPTAKVKAKKVSSTKKIPQKNQVVESTTRIEEKKTPKTLSTDQRNQLRNLIRERNFFSAEAQINQALNKDNSQHELYLLLLEIHLLQKDEFATNQLINQLRSLELDDILEQALAQKAAHDQQPLSAPEHLFFKPEVSVTVSSEKNNSDDFDQLMTPSAAPVTNTASFAQLQQETLTAKTERSDEIKPLEFNTLSFNSNPIATAESEAIPASIEVEDVKPLEFNTLSFSSNPSATAAPEPIAAAKEIQALDFSLSLDTPIVEQPTTVLDTDTASSLDQKPEFDFDFVSPTTLTPVEEKVVVAETQPLLDFNFTLEPTLETASEEELLVSATTEAPDVNFDIQTNSSFTQPIDAHDPLVQSFPELINVNEINLNLELAAHYIQLGTFESARELLEEQAVKYSAEQQQKADQLRNQIAS